MVVERNTKNVVGLINNQILRHICKVKGANMEGIYLYKEKVEEIRHMIGELGSSL